MEKYIAFLRAINVGGHTVKMDYLKSLFHAMDFNNVETFIASGNVIFDTDAEDKKKIEKKIEEHLKSELGYEVKTFIRTPNELKDIINFRPFKTIDHTLKVNTLMIAFLPETPLPGAQKNLQVFKTETDDFLINGTEVYWLTGKKISDSKFSGALLEKTLGMPSTMRNSTTVRKIAEKYK